MGADRIQNRRLQPTQRGVALLMVTISIALLTAAAVDFAFNSRVDLEMATNQRDELRAHYLARSGIGLARLLIKFQKQLDTMPIPGMDLGALASNPMVAQMAKGMGIDPATLSSLTGGGAPGGAPGAGALSIQLWKMARVDCHMLQGMTGGAAGESEEAEPTQFQHDAPAAQAEKPQRQFGGFSGCFLAEIKDEEEKLNLNKLDMGPLDNQANVRGFLDLFSDKRFEFLYEKPDAHGLKANAQDILIALHDWIDEDQVQASLNLTGQGDPFQAGFSDEGYGYDKYTPRFKPKNQLFDTLDEVYQVYGVTDRFMAAFKNRLTVYPEKNAKLNINTDDPLMLYVAILSVADPARPDPRLRDPIFVDQLIEKVRQARLFTLFPGMGMTVQGFMGAVAAAGVAVNSSILNNVRNNRVVSDKTSTFSIRSTGEAGSVQRTLHAVVRADAGLGRLVYWREE